MKKNHSSSRPIFFSDSHVAEKKELINEIVSLKKELERKELDQARKISENEKMKLDYDTAIVDLKESTSKINVTLAQVGIIIVYSLFSVIRSSMDHDSN